jgi:hypothetical protein
MFLPDEQIVCVDDKDPNLFCHFPSGYVVEGQVYRVIQMFPRGGVDIAGLPVFNYLLHEDVGWKATRFRRLYDPEEETDSESLELAATMS